MFHVNIIMVLTMTFHRERLFNIAVNSPYRRPMHKWQVRRDNPETWAILGTRHRMKTGKTTTKSTCIYRKLRNEQHRPNKAK